MTRLFTLEINSVVLPWNLLHYRRTAPFGSDVIDAIMPGRVTVVGEQTIVIKEDGTTRASGKIYDFGYDKSRNRIVTRVLGSSLEKKHSEMEMDDRIYRGNSGKQILEDDLGSTDLTAGTINASTPMYMEFGQNEESIWNRRDAWFETALIDDFEIYVSPTGAVDYKAACGVDRGVTPTISTTKFQGAENILRWLVPHKEDHKHKSDKVIVIGRKEGVYQAFGIAGAGAAVYRFYRKNLHCMDSCIDASATIHGDMQNASKWGKFSCMDEGLTYDVYDTVYIVDKDYGVDGDYRIYEIDRRISRGGVITEILYTDLTNLTVNGPLLLDRSRANYELAKGQVALQAAGSVPFNIKELNYLSKLGGEDTTGYLQGVAAGGIVTLSKDYLQLETGVGLGHAWIESNTEMVLFAKNPGFDLRFMINNLVDPAEDRRAYGGIYNAAGNRGFWFYLQGFKLYAINQDAGAFTVTLLLDPISTATWYKVSAYQRVNGKIYFYLDNILEATHSTNVPLANTAKSLCAYQYANANAGGRNYTIWFDNFEVFQQYEL